MQSAAIPSSSVSSEAGASTEWDGLAAAAVLWQGQLETSRRIYRDKLKARMR